MSTDEQPTLLDLTRIFQDAERASSALQMRLADAEAARDRLESELAQERAQRLDAVARLEAETRVRAALQDQLRAAKEELREQMRVFGTLGQDMKNRAERVLEMCGGGGDSVSSTFTASTVKPEPLTDAQEAEVLAGLGTRVIAPTAPSPRAPASTVPEDSTPGKQVRDWRHRLQKEFLHPNGIIPENMPAMDELLRTVEEYGDKMTAADLIATKIGKVLRHISLLAPAKIPREDEYRFIARAAALMEVYTSIMLTKRDKDVAQDNEEQKPGSSDTDERKLRRQSGLTEATDDFTLVDCHTVDQT